MQRQETTLHGVFNHLIDGERVFNNAHSPDISREDYS
jgi:hypothetical protein